MEILEICLQKRLLIKRYVVKHLTLLKIQNMMVIKKILLQWFIKILIKDPFYVKLLRKLAFTPDNDILFIYNAYITVIWVDM